ncbi:sensor histidine kinase [Bacillus cereus]|uniref:sensor histidine kinase n=1 Tax=Bacillus cereus TaxID=1396 RepID=UPI000C287858|nr:sensor histidine kinase [Bacillus cereus]
MKLFLREHIPLIFYVIFQLLFILLIYWIDGYNDLLTMLYVFFIGIVLLIVYLLYRYFSHQNLYKRLSKPSEKWNDVIQKPDSTPLSIAMNNALKMQYYYYQGQLKSWERKQKEHLTFMNQWVHQMKTPLSVINLITEDNDFEGCESISEETERIKQGLDMVLYMARLETFEQDFHVEDVSLRKLVNEVIHENKSSFLRNYVYPEIKIESELMVKTDAKWLRFILNQIISNSIKYSAGNRDKVTISTFTEERVIILQIKDRGVGVPKADLPRVFRPFYTGENGRLFQESTGMGLYLVKEVAKKLNHTIELKSELGEGTVVRIIFRHTFR